MYGHSREYAEVGHLTRVLGRVIVDKGKSFQHIEKQVTFQELAFVGLALALQDEWTVISPTVFRRYSKYGTANCDRGLRGEQKSY